MGGRPGPAGTIRTLTFRLAALLLGVLLATFLGEATLRLLAPHSLEITVTDVREFVQFDARLGWVNRPGSKGRLRFLPDFDTEVRINAHGLRDREIPYERSPGTGRILALGDSMTFGQGVGTEECWPKVLERRLGESVEVANGGVSGWGTAQERLWLESEGLRYRPDLVIVGLYVNDFWDNAPSTDSRVPRPLFVLRDGNLSVTNLPLARPAGGRWQDAGAYLENNALLFRLLAKGWLWVDLGLLRPTDLAPIGPVDRDRGVRKPRAPIALPAVGETGALLSEMDRLCRDHQATLLVLLLAGHWHVRPSLRGLGGFFWQRDAYETATKLCADRGLSAVETYPELAGAEERGAPVFHPIDMHLNASGHRLVAELLKRRIEGERLLSPAP